jgi:hypothetical protein
VKKKIYRLIKRRIATFVVWWLHKYMYKYVVRLKKPDKVFLVKDMNVDSIIVPNNIDIVRLDNSVVTYIQTASLGSLQMYASTILGNIDTIGN